MTDSRDGQTYKTVTIGKQTWMAQNLNYAYIGVPFKYRSYTSDSISWCYGNDLANCSKYGRLYTWAAAMDSVGRWTTNGKGCGYGVTCSPTRPVRVRGVCPEGWHLPTDTEWSNLFTAVGGYKTAGAKLKSTSGWASSTYGGTDAYSFSVLPAGNRDYDGNFDSRFRTATFWSPAESSTDDYAHAMYFNYDAIDGFLGGNYKYFGFSVRCVKD